MSYLYTLHRDEKQRVANYFEPGMSRKRLSSRDDFGAWTILLDEPERVLMRHYNGAMMWVTLKDDKAMSYELVEGEAAEALDHEHGG
jgi:hypothetical protein